MQPAALTCLAGHVQQVQGILAGGKWDMDLRLQGWLGCWLLRAPLPGKHDPRGQVSLLAWQRCLALPCAVSLGPGATALLDGAQDLDFHLRCHIWHVVSEHLGGRVTPTGGPTA